MFIGSWRLLLLSDPFASLAPASAFTAAPFNSNHKNLCWVTRTCVTIKYMTRDEWGWISSCLKITLVQQHSPSSQHTNSPYALFGIKTIFKDISTDVKFISRSRACLKYVHMCIYVLDIIIMHISPAFLFSLERKWLKKQIFHDWA